MAPPKRKIVNDANDHRKAKLLRQQIDEDDAIIRDLEKKLGIKKSQKSIPKAFKDDGLEDLFITKLKETEDSGDETKKQKTEYEAFLEAKRAKAGAVPAFVPKRRQLITPNDGLSDLERSDSLDETPEEDFDELGESEEQASEAVNFEGLNDSMADDEEFDSDHFGSDLSGEEAKNSTKPKTRENPYVAPTTGCVVEKYIPPSLRKTAQNASEQDIRLQRQLNGYLNKLSESNLLGILKNVEKVYEDNARGNANDALIGALMSQVCNPAALPDTFYIMTAGFSTAVYKVIGESFGSQLVTKVVELFQKEYNVAKALDGQPTKATSNLITFMTELYVFQLVGCNMIFDFLRMLLEDITELATELILRIVRLGGKYLRKDDPQSIKDIVNTLSSSTSSSSNSDFSVRTKFMIETITDLKNNKLKAGVQESAVAAEHVARMRRLLGGMNQRRLAANGPMRFGLRDIALAETKGKWWITGSSYQDPRKAEASKQVTEALEKKSKLVSGSTISSGYASTDSEDYEFWLPENKLRTLALDMGLKKEVQQHILIAIAGAANVDDAVVHFRKLNLNKLHRTEAALVLITCAGGEHPYNPFYVAVARKLATDSRIRYAFKSQLLAIFRQLGEALFNEDDDNDDGDLNNFDDDSLVNIGKFVGALIVDGSMSLKTLQAIDFPTMKKRTGVIIKSLLKSVLAEAIRAGKSESHKGEAVGSEITILRVLKDANDTSMTGGLQFLFSEIYESGGLKKAEKRACKIAQSALDKQSM